MADRRDTRTVDDVVNGVPFEHEPFPTLERGSRVQWVNDGSAFVQPGGGMIDLPLRVELVGGGVAMVDSSDGPLIAPYRWRRHAHGYAVASVAVRAHANRFVLMHRLILGLGDSTQHVDHANGDKADNRRSNLRRCTRGQNQANRFKTNGRHPFKGINLRRNGLWAAQTKCQQKSVHLGYYGSAEDAARAYDAYMVITFGDFARTNFADVDALDVALARRVYRRMRGAT